MEAMAAGCLVLSTRVGGVAELVDDRESSRSGFLVDAGSVQALADGLRAVAATHPEQRREIRRRARQTVLERYDIRRNGAAVAELLRSRG
jgi:colanic acid/amylovoran biosynthesis glycosyltransferase